METRTSKRTGCLSSILSMGIFLLVGAGLSFWGWNILQDARASASWPSRRRQGHKIGSHTQHRCRRRRFIQPRK